MSTVRAGNRSCVAMACLVLATGAGAAAAQQSPPGRTSATEDTEVDIADDADNLYFGFYLRYSDASMMRANRVDRDRAFQDDLITIYIDTVLDQQRSFEFDLNAYNVQGYGIVNAGRGGFGNAPIPPADRSWNVLFFSAAAISPSSSTSSGRSSSRAPRSSISRGRLARRDEGAEWASATEEQRRQAGCPAWELFRELL